MKYLHLLFCILIFVSFLNGCQPLSDKISPEIQAPEKWTNTQGLHTSLQEEIVWWALFQDPLLTKLVKDALNTNLSLKITIAQIRQTRAQLSNAISNLYPLVNTTGSITHNKPSKTTPTALSTGDSYDLFQIGFDATWELDFFGKLESAKEAALATFYSQVEALHAARLSLISEIAQNYILLRSAQQQYSILQSSIEKWEELYILTQNLQEAGLANAISVQQIKISLEQAKATIYPLQSLIKTTIHQLSYLTNHSPTDLYQTLLPPKAIPQMPTQIFLGLPSDLLKRRPDIRKAKKDLETAAAEVGVAKASLFPQFSLTGKMGYESKKGAALFKSNSIFSSFGPSFSWPIFDFGRVQSQIEVQKAFQDQEVYQYKNTILAAFKEVESALVNLSREKQHSKALEQALLGAIEAKKLSYARFQLGQIDFPTVLQACIAENSASLTFIQSQQAVALNTIALYKALGGGWQVQEKYPKNSF